MNENDRDPLVLGNVEIDRLIERFHLAATFDKRGPEIRLLTYAEKLDLLPRLLTTVVHLRNQLRIAAEKCEATE